MRLSIDCSACNISVPVNGVVSSVRCYHCGETQSLDPAFWNNAFEAEYFGEALGFAEGEGKQISSIGARRYRLAYGRRTPRCQACKGPDLDLLSLGTLIEHGRCFCPACGQGIRLRLADELARAINTRAVMVVGETALSGAEQAMQAKTTPILFQCMGCGGALKVDGSTRAVSCEHCGNSNYLPDGLWNQLRPVPKEQVFFLVCEYDQTAAREAQWSTEDGRIQAAASQQLTLEEALRLAKDSEDDVRIALARNGATPNDALWALAGDDDDDVIEALMGRADLHPAIVDKVAQHSDYDARVLAAKHAQCPLETLHRLANDDDDDVKTTAQERLAALKAQGVDVGGPQGKKGLFSKLFGG